MKRREFIYYLGVGAIASYLPVALVACTESDSVSETESNAAPTILTLGTLEQLEQTGFLLDEEAEIMVVQDSTGELIAVNPTCTHQGCTVEWQNDENVFLCPCHAAKYAPDGEVLAQPAPSPLPTYKAIAEQGTISVEI